MNKHGQSLIIFVILLPIIAFFIAFFIDSSIMLLENNRIKNITKEIAEIAIKEDIKDTLKIKNVINSNENIESIVIIKDNNLKITSTSKKKSFFNNFFKVKWIESVSFCVNYAEKRVNKC